MRRSAVLTVGAAISLVGPLTTVVIGSAAAAAATNEVADPNEPAVPDAADLQSADIEYSATSFSVTTVTYAAAKATDTFTLTVHLTGFDPEVRISGRLLNGVWRGATTRVGDGPDRPQVTNLDYMKDWDCDAGIEFPPIHNPWGPYRRTFHTTGNWAENPTPQPVPASMTWFATVTDAAGAVLDSTAVATATRSADAPTLLSLNSPTIQTAYHASFTGYVNTPAEPLTYGRVVDLQWRAANETFTPATSGRTLGYPSGPAPAYTWPSGCQIRSDSVWTTSYPRLDRTMLLRGYFQGDGTLEPVFGAEFKLRVRAWVTLDVPRWVPFNMQTLRYVMPRGTAVPFHGVVRPMKVGKQVTLQVRRGPAGLPWSTAKTLSLIKGRYDTYYAWTWRPLSPGTYVMRTVWTDGATQSVGGNDVGISSYAIFIVT